MKIKKIGAFALTLVLGLSLSACGNTKTTDSEAGTASSGAESAAPALEGAGGEKEVTLTMMYSGTKAADKEDFEIDVLPKLIKEKYPNMNMEVTKLPDDQYYTSLKTKLATGEASDFILAQPRFAGANSVYSLAKSGYLLDISDLSVMDKVGSGKEDFTYEGKTYAVPSGVTFLATYYNKDMFAANGLEVPTNWEEFLNCCETLKQVGIQPIVMGDKDSYVMQFGLYQLAANQVYPENPEFDNQLGEGGTHFTDGQWDKVLDMYYELYAKGYIADNTLGLGAAQAIQKFVDGEVAMTFDGSFNAPALTAKGAVEFEAGLFPCPANDKGKPVFVSAASGAGPAIFSGTKNPEEAKSVLEYWFDGKSDLFKAYANSGKVIVTYGEGVETLPLFDECMEVYRAGNAFYWCNQGWPAGVESEMQAKFGEMIGGMDTTIPQITEAMQAKFEELYAQ